MVSAQIIADSMCHTRITTFKVVIQRYVLCELNTHKMICKNSASSRAIPVSKRIAQVQRNPAGPTWWGSNQRGMQSTAGLGVDQRNTAESAWSRAASAAILYAEILEKCEAHKQFANRILEPFVWHTCLLTGTEWANFFNLRVSEYAAPEFDLLAGLMLREYANSVPVELKSGQWHLPYGDRIPSGLEQNKQLMVSAARCARLSYETQDGEFSVEKDLELAKRLLDSGHMSPFEHQAQAWSPRVEDIRDPVPTKSLSDFGRWLERQNAAWDGDNCWWGPLRWWRQYRKILTNENQSDLTNIPYMLEQWEGRMRERGIEV